MDTRSRWSFPPQATLRRRSSCCSATSVQRHCCTARRVSTFLKPFMLRPKIASAGFRRQRTRSCAVATLWMPFRSLRRLKRLGTSPSWVSTPLTPPVTPSKPPMTLCEWHTPELSRSVFVLTNSTRPGQYTGLTHWSPCLLHRQTVVYVQKMVPRKLCTNRYLQESVSLTRYHSSTSVIQPFVKRSDHKLTRKLQAGSVGGQLPKQRRLRQQVCYSPGDRHATRL